MPTRNISLTPEQDAQYREFRALMESDPEWHDGVIEQD